MKKILIVAPHPDDVEMAMGGTLAKMLDAGWNVTVVDLTDGEPTPYGSKEIRKAETQKANQILGIKQRLCLDMTNRYLLYNLENRRKIAEIIRLNEPVMLFGPVTPDYHPDHIETARLLTAARFEAKLHKTNVQGRPHWAHRLYFYYATHRTEYHNPSFLVDVTEYWDRKINAVKAYQSQLKNVPEILQQLEIVCRYFGRCIGVKFAEPFISSEPLTVKNIESLADS